MSGFLYIPSLKEKKFVLVSGVTLEEALTLTNEFTERVKKQCKLKDAGSVEVGMVAYNNVISTENNDINVEGHEVSDFNGSELDEIATLLRISTARGTRGARCVYVDSAGSFAVGTTVVYNPNWATLGFEDDGVLAKVANSGIVLSEGVTGTDAPTDGNSYW